MTKNWLKIVDFGLKLAKNCFLNDFRLIKFGRILPNLRLNLVKFDNKIIIRPNSTFEFKL